MCKQNILKKCIVFVIWNLPTQIWSGCGDDTISVLFTVATKTFEAGLEFELYSARGRFLRFCELDCDIVIESSENREEKNFQSNSSIDALIQNSPAVFCALICLLDDFESFFTRNNIQTKILNHNVLQKICLFALNVQTYQDPNAIVTYSYYLISLKSCLIPMLDSK